MNTLLKTLFCVLICIPTIWAMDNNDRAALKKSVGKLFQNSESDSELSQDVEKWQSSQFFFSRSNSEQSDATSSGNQKNDGFNGSDEEIGICGLCDMNLLNCSFGFNIKLNVYLCSDCQRNNSDESYFEDSTDDSTVIFMPIPKTCEIPSPESIAPQSYSDNSNSDNDAFSFDHKKLNRNSHERSCLHKSKRKALRTLKYLAKKEMAVSKQEKQWQKMLTPSK